MKETAKILPKYRISMTNQINLSIKEKHNESKKTSKRKKTHEKYIEELEIKNPYIVPIEKYINDRTKINHKCLIHDVVFNSTPNNILAGQGCKQCKSEKISKAKRTTPQKYVDKLKVRNPNLIPLDSYIDNDTPILHLYEKCGHQVEISPKNAYKGNGCIICARKKKQKTHEQYVNELKVKNPEVIVLEKYITANTPILHLHKHCGHETKMPPSDALNGNGCIVCRNVNTADKCRKTHEEYVQEIKLKNPDVIPLERYVNAKTPIVHYHTICGHKTKMLPSSVLNGSGCILCKGIKIRNSSIKTHDQFVEELFEINPTVEIISIYNGQMQNIKCKCTICGNIWETRAGHLLEAHGCPACHESIGERSIRIFLESKNIFYMRNHKYEDLFGVNGGLLSYDFYSPRYNLLIEFQGEQHERPVGYFGGIKTFIKQKIHDTRKRKYCHDNNINFLEIWYYEIHKTEQIVEQYLNNLKSLSVETTGAT